MALLRVTAASLFALAACSTAGADSSSVPENIFSGLEAPAGWTSLPAIADVARDAAQTAGAKVTGREAWGEPARGCYAVWMQLRGSGATADAVIESLAGAKSGFVASDVVKPTAVPGTLTLAWKRGVYTGKLRAKIDKENLAVLSCFANDREPKACEAGCNTLLGALP